jgi:endoglucanase
MQYQIASFLERNKFNAVRLPLMAQWLLDNKVPNAHLINKAANRGVSVKDYMSLIKSLVKVLQFRNIGVLFSMHTLTLDDSGVLWYGAGFPETKFLDSIDVLTKNLCDKEYWNIMGIDLKNEPYKATWGDGSPTDFRDGAKRIADRMLKGCSQWMGFVEGVYSETNTLTLDGETLKYSDWYGGGLQGVKSKPLEFSTKNKLVWAPHYYTPAVYPQPYYFASKTGQAFVELSDDALRGRIQGTMNAMFGYLASETGPAMLLGEFGGLYSTDAHPKKTTKRCTDFTIEVITKPGWAGGFVWSLNPESKYDYNPADKQGTFVEGVLERDWLSANKDYLAALAAMNGMANLRPFPCFPMKAA